MDDMENSGMGLGGIDINSGRCGGDQGQVAAGEDGNMGGCSVDNVALFGMLSRMVG